MFYALGKWNMWFPVMIYINKNEYWTLQYFLRVVVFDKFITTANSGESLLGDAENIPEENFRMAAIILVAAPIVCIYPFVQKYFVKGIITGSVKG
jgi:ABC-type glycerol-3-phosphate transport system permease component